MPTLDLKPNTTIKLTPGETYTGITGLVGQYFALPVGCSIIGRTSTAEPYPVLRIPSTPEGYAFKFQHNGCMLHGFQQIGGGIFGEGPNGINDGSFVDDVAFTNDHTRGSKAHALEFSCLMRNARITRCIFAGKNFGLYTDKGYDNATVANNWFDQIAAGIHLDANQVSKKLLIEQNYFRGMIGMGIELQGTSSDITVQDNWYEDPRYIYDSSKMAYSLILDKSGTIRTLRNVHISKTLAQEPTAFVRDIFEAGGDDHLLSDNYSDGGNCILAGNDGVGTCSVTLDGNRFKNYREPPRLSFAAPGRSLTVKNTSATQALSATMEDRIAKLLKPQRFARYSTGVSPVPLPPIEDPELARLKAENAKLTAERDAANATLDRVREAVK